MTTNKLEKITDVDLVANGPSRRQYDDACGTAHALDLLGERWALLVVRELMLGPRRFSDLRAELPGISANVLTQRLEGLEATGILQKMRLPPPANVQVYGLTPWGLESEPIFQTMGRWAARSPLHDPTRPFSAVSLFLSFRTMIEKSRAAGLSAVIGFVLGKDSFRATIRDGAISVVRGDARPADLVVSAEARMIAAAVYGSVPLSALTASGALELEGDLALAERFVTLFPLPAKVQAGAALTPPCGQGHPLLR
jgi:DNA-binding HxlR family transcriptional regulator/putative sterol carrier protein